MCASARGEETWALEEEGRRGCRGGRAGVVV